MNTRTKQLDNLTVIKGIGPARQEWLISKFGIRTFHDLAASSPGDILAQLKSDGLFASHGEVEKWIAKAAELANAEPLCPPGDWLPFASFVVEFQARPGKDGAAEHCTAVQHMESEIEQKWQGIETSELCRWMRERVEPHVAESSSGELSTASTVPLTRLLPYSLSIHQVQLFQPPVAKEPAAISKDGQMFQGFVKAGKPFALRVTTSISGLNGNHLKENPINGSVQVYAREFPHGDLQLLGNTVSFSMVAGRGIYLAGLADVTLQAGLYAFMILTWLEVDPHQMKILDVPLLQVC